MRHTYKLRMSRFKKNYESQINWVIIKTKKAETPITGTDFAYITTQIITSQNINLKS